MKDGQEDKKELIFRVQHSSLPKAEEASATLKKELRQVAGLEFRVKPGIGADSKGMLVPKSTTLEVAGSDEALSQAKEIAQRIISRLNDPDLNIRIIEGYPNVGNRFALIVGCSTYEDASLRSLHAPPADIEELSDVLNDPEVGGFSEVDWIFNANKRDVDLKIGHFLKGKPYDSLVTLYFTGHGVKDLGGKWYFPVKDTLMTDLSDTAVSGDAVRDKLARCLSKQKVLFLDCCYSGAFDMDTRSLDIADVFEKADRQGICVISASSDLGLAWDSTREEQGQRRPSVFTRHVVEGLKTGVSDLDDDGDIDLAELHRYVCDRLRQEPAPQESFSRPEDLPKDIVIAKAKAERGLDIEAELNIEPWEAREGCAKTIQTKDSRRVKATVDPGAKNGAVIALKGRGLRGRHGGEPGDLLLTLIVAEEEAGAHDFAELVVSPEEAKKGATKQVIGQHCGVIDVPVPPGSKDGEQLISKGKGEPGFRGGPPGHLVITLRIVSPTQKRSLIERIRDARVHFQRPGADSRIERRLTEVERDLREGRVRVLLLYNQSKVLDSCLDVLERVSTKFRPVLLDLTTVNGNRTESDGNPQIVIWVNYRVTVLPLTPLVAKDGLPIGRGEQSIFSSHTSISREHFFITQRHSRGAKPEWLIECKGRHWATSNGQSMRPGPQVLTDGDKYAFPDEAELASLTFFETPRPRWTFEGQLKTTDVIVVLGDGGTDAPANFSPANLPNHAWAFLQVITSEGFQELPGASSYPVYKTINNQSGWSRDLSDFLEELLEKNDLWKMRLSETLSDIESELSST